MVQKRYAYGVLILFLLVLPQGSLGGIWIRTWLVYLAAAVGGILLLQRKKKEGRRRTIEVLDWLVGFFLVWNILLVVIRSLREESAQEPLFIVAVLVCFFLLSLQTEMINYRQVITLCAVFPLICLLFHYLLDEDYTFGIKLLISEEGAAVPLLLVLGTVAAGNYVSGEDTRPSWISCVIAVADFLVLFLTQNVPGILLQGLGLILLLLFEEPEKQIIQRGMQIILLYFLLLANMPLLAMLWKKDMIYSLEGGVYLELLIALAAAVFFHWWDKLSADTKKLSCFHYILKLFLIGAGILFVILLGFTERLSSMEGVACRQLAWIGGKIREWCLGHNGTALDILADYGLLGGIFLLAVVLAVWKKILERQKEKDADDLLLTLTVLYLLQSLFFSQQTAAAPVWLFLGAMALYGSKKSRKDNEEKLWSELKDKV